ncbi:hypothetical protein EWM64_g6274 [Hericium alpestre]|uniref:F-box domain-containing protein n=1 Tax=Hericium alpestre TaxID=135208 RepID=A0A4Y9ZW74_9AGAM|nr:hypothetical protein EWM64_g6274 [Hericium alpestre]
MIDEELEAMHLALCSLRTHRNTLTPISGLPLEILAWILQLHANDQPPSKRDLGWIRVTHVCRLWRDAALHHPALWANVTTEPGSRWLDLMLERAKSGPLSYRQVKCGKDSKDFLSHVLPHLFPRIHSFSVDDTPEAVSVVAQSLKFAAPMLDALELIVVSPPGRHHRSLLPEGIFDNNSPVLRRLHLKGIRVAWSVPILRGLTHLHIEEEGNPNHTHGLDGGFFHALKGLPALEILYLANVLPDEVLSLDNGSVPLLRLRSLTLVGEGPSRLYVLGRLEIPSSCRLRLQCEYYNESELEACLPMLCGHFSATPDPFHTLSLVDIDETRTDLKLWRESNIRDSSTLHPPVDPDLVISASCPTEPYRPLDPLEIMCDTLPLSDIRTILIQRREFTMRGDQWKRLFAANCQKVNNVFMSKELEAMDLCRVLSTRLGNAQGTAFTPDQLFLPDLKLLSLQSVNLGYCTGWHDKFVDVGDVFVNTFNMRRTRGRAISTIRLGRGCVVSAAQLNALRDIVYVELNPDVVLELPEASVAGSR